MNSFSNDNHMELTELNIGKPKVILLGAGTPKVGSEHSALIKASNSIKVIDWFENSISALGSEITFVSGYKESEFKRLYPSFEFVSNPLWGTTGSAYSLISAINESECYAFYSDIVFRQTLVETLKETSGDVVVAVDSLWLNRFVGRSEEDISGAEKVICASHIATLLGQDIQSEIANSEFIGAVKFSKKASLFLSSQSHGLKEKFFKSNLSQLIEYLRQLGLEIKVVDVHGEWAELNQPQDLAHFILGTKAQTLHRLQPMLKHSVVENQVSFTIEEWTREPSKIIKRIQSELNSPKVVIRSSALSEDGFTESNAGAYTSLLDIETEDKKHLKSMIEIVISSYPDTNKDNQVLVQPMLEDVDVSGVIFTRTLSSSAPYYFLNYDDTTGSTESITSGTSKEGKTVVICKNAFKDNINIPENIRSVLPALKEIESLLHYDSLDIEFAITKDKKVHILQVRPIAVMNDLSTSLNDEDFFAFIKRLEYKFDEIQKTSPFIYGHKTIFGVMPDWNPAEIIGIKPRPLAISLYKYLIMDDVWAKQRAEYGYKDVRPQKLLYSFAGQPYVNVTASFSSFIPMNIDSELSNKLVNFYLDWLIKNPHLHDKVEFDVVPTCVTFDFHKWEKRFLDNGFQKEEVQILKNELKAITTNAVKQNVSYLDKIRLCEKRFEEIKASNLNQLEKVELLLGDCKEHGTLPFAHLARSAFIAVNILKSAISENIITSQEYEIFINSIRTVSHEFTSDAYKITKSEMDWDTFVQKYGHLRPGTYDITSSCYFDDPEKYLKPAVATSSDRNDPVEHNKDWDIALSKLVNSLNNMGIYLSNTELDLFLRGAIEGREYGKFIFSRNLSLSLDIIKSWGGQLGLDKDDLSYLKLTDIFEGSELHISEIRLKLQHKIVIAKQKQGENVAVELPQLITKADDFQCFVYPSSQANFISKSSIATSIINITGSDIDTDLSGKIILIEQADPGFDWLFGRKIGGLITKYGGANSHMAIRSAEFGLPAAIGVGESIFKKLERAKEVELDPVNQIIRVIN
jgi:choline kinase/phosphohistidine swiveling domain-containing protein